MKILDCHVHMKGEVSDAAGVLRAMDENEVEKMIVLSKNERTSLAQTGKNLESTRRLIDQAPDRFIGLAWPVSVAAFVYGSITHLLDRSVQSK